MDKPGEFKITEENVVYRPKTQGRLPITEADWNRLKRIAAAIVPGRLLYQTVSNLAFGVSGSAFVTLVGYFFITDLPKWIFPATLGTLAVFSIIGLGFLALDGQQRKLIASSVAYLTSEMEELEKGFQRPEPLPPEPSSRS